MVVPYTSSWIARLSPANDGEIQVAFGVDNQLADLRKNLFERLHIEAARGHLRALAYFKTASCWRRARTSTAMSVRFWKKRRTAANQGENEWQHGFTPF